MAETLSILSIVAFSLAGVSLALAIFFWFFFKIPSVIGDLSGRNARKSIAKMRAENEKTISQSRKTGRTNLEHRKPAAPVKHSGKLESKKKAEDDRPDTGLLTENRAVNLASEPTSVLMSATTGLLVDEEATAPLGTLTQNHQKPGGGKKFIMLDEVMIIHTDEEID